MSGRAHTVTAILLAIVGLYLVRLSGVEIQPWDEGLYAVRGESMVLFDQWWDQTPHALGGLYSSTPPPVTSWGVAVGTMMLGHTTFGVRLFTILFSGIALWLVYRIGTRFLSEQAALAAMIALGTALPWVVYSRQAMTEVPLMMFSLLGLYAALTIKDGTRGWLHPALGVLAIAGALLSKMTVGVLPALFFLPLLTHPKVRWKAVAVVAVGLALAAPWYAMMFGRYGQDIWLAMSIPHAFGVVEQNVRSLGPLYYANQLFRGQPLTIVAVFYVVAATVHRQFLPDKDRADVITVLLWFVLAMLVFSIAPTKNPHYSVMILPPAILTALYAYERLVGMAPRRLTVVMYATLLIATIYAVVPQIGTAIKTMHLDAGAVVGLVAIAALAIASVSMPKRWIDQVAVYGYRSVVVVVLGVGGLLAARTVFAGRAEDIKGGRQVAVALQEQAEYYKEFAYLYHQHNSGDAMNPQLAWYTAGWMNGWLDAYSYLPIHMPESTYDLNAVAELATAPLPWVVYYHPGIADSVQTSVMAALSVSYNVYEQLDHYTLFVKR